MALRHPQALLGTFQRAGVLCTATGRTCLAHGLPATPDSVLFSPTALNEVTCTGTGIYLESWSSTHVSFVNSSGNLQALYIRLAVEHSIVA